MRLSYILCILIIFMQASFARRGGGVSGGGVGIINQYGQVFLTDTYDGHNTSFDINKVLKDHFYSENRYVRKAFEKDSNFFDCASKIFNNTDIFILGELASELSLTPVYMTEFRFNLVKTKKEYHQKLNNFPYTLSTSYPQNLSSSHVALAIYNDGALFVQKRFFNALSKEDQCALSVHEGIRRLSNIYTIFSDENITAFTRYLLKKKLSKDQKWQVKYMLNFFFDTKKLQPIFRNVEISEREAYSYIFTGSSSRITQKDGRYYVYKKDYFLNRPSKVQSNKILKRYELLFKKHRFFDSFLQRFSY